MRIVQLMASPFFGGPERQMLGMSRRLSADCETMFLTFAEGGKARSLIDEVRRAGLVGEALTSNFPRVGRCVAEIESRLREWRADVLCTSGYKPDILGWRAARKAGIPIVVVSHGWTGVTAKVRFYERIDRWVHCRADAVVSVSGAQAAKVLAAGVPHERMTTIVNAVAEEAFAAAEPAYADRLRNLFASPPRWMIGAAGRLSPEKGFDQLVLAAARLMRSHPDAGVVIFGDGPLRSSLEMQIESLGLAGKVVLAGFRDDVSKFLPHIDVGVLSSHTEGLPVVLLEMMAAGRPVVATAVGGIPEVIEEDVSGWLVPPGNAAGLAERIAHFLDNPGERRRVGAAGREVVRERFGVQKQSEAYRDLFASVLDLAPNRRSNNRKNGVGVMHRPSERET